MITIDTYDRLQTYIFAYAYQDINLLLIESKGGLGKTRHAKQAVKGKPFHYISGHITPLEFYNQLYENRGKLIILDDVDMLLKNKLCVSIMKQLCETEKIKTLQYNTSRGSIAPEKFTTTSKVLLLANDIKQSNKDMEALLTRGIHIKFCPSPMEVIHHLESWAEDKTVLSLFKMIAEHTGHVSLRTYVHAVQLRKSNLDWEAYVLEELNIHPLMMEELRKEESL